jgi:hypothetical protein
MRERSCLIGVTTGPPPNVHPRVAAIDPTQVRKRLSERGVERLCLVFVGRHEHADAPHPLGLLRVRRER